jgi:AICAR transformylase/IMP cyclohydrolase PurH
MDEYEVKMMTDVGDVLVEYVIAPDVERAAWQALELSSQRNCTLKDVRMSDEW